MRLFSNIISTRIPRHKIAEMIMYHDKVLDSLCKLNKCSHRKTESSFEILALERTVSKHKLGRNTSSSMDRFQAHRKETITLFLMDSKYLSKINNQSLQHTRKSKLACNNGVPLCMGNCFAVTMGIEPPTSSFKLQNLET